MIVRRNGIMLPGIESVVTEKDGTFNFCDGFADMAPETARKFCTLRDKDNQPLGLLVDEPITILNPARPAAPAAPATPAKE